MIRNLVLSAVAALTLSACTKVDDSSGAPDDSASMTLAELDISGDAPSAVSLNSQDRVIITGDQPFSITVEAPAELKAQMRFSLVDGSLTVRRVNGDRTPGTATIRITLPQAPSALGLAGSGQIDASRLDGMGIRGGNIDLAGSGTITIDDVQAKALTVALSGSGEVTASGTAERLELDIAGSGNGNLDRLIVGEADVSVAGSGDVNFASNGTVDAAIAGSGNVTVYGKAQCSADSMGAGRLICKSNADAVGVSASGQTLGSRPPT